MGHRVKKFNELTDELQKTIQEAKDKLLKAILDDTEISKVEKLLLISDNNLFKTESYICRPFDDTYREEYLNILREKGENRPMIDDWFHRQDYQRYQVVNLAEVVETISEDDFYQDDDNLITIYTNRSRTNNEAFKISKYEFIDTIYDWCIKNKCIAFELDW